MKFLILKPCCAGDVVMATATLAALRRAYPDATIAWAVGAWARPLLAHDPRLNALIEAGPTGLPFRKMLNLRRGPGHALAQLVARMRAGRFDVCLVLDRSPLLALAAWQAGIPRRIGLGSGWRGWLHTTRVPVAGVQHEAELYLDCARALRIDVEGAYPQFYPSAADGAFAAARLAEWTGPGPLVLLNPAGGTNPGMRLTVKRWPAARLAALGTRLIAERGARVALVAGPGDRALLAEVQAGLPRPVPALALEWGQAGALARHADLYVGNDTGMTHVAAAAGAPVIAIFGPSDPRRYAPYAPKGQVITLWRETALPAGGVAHGAPKDFSWENGINADEAYEAAVKLLPGRT